MSDPGSLVYIVNYAWTHSLDRPCSRLSAIFSYYMYEAGKERKKEWKNWHGHPNLASSFSCVFLGNAHIKYTPSIQKKKKKTIELSSCTYIELLNMQSSIFFYDPIYFNYKRLKKDFEAKKVRFNSEDFGTAIVSDRCNAPQWLFRDFDSQLKGDWKLAPSSKLLDSFFFTPGAVNLISCCCPKS